MKQTSLLFIFIHICFLFGYSQSEDQALRLVNNAIENFDLNDPENSISYSYTANIEIVIDTTDHGEGNHLLCAKSSIKKIFKYSGKKKEQVMGSKIEGQRDPMLILIVSQIQSITLEDHYFTILDNKYLNPLHHLNSFTFKVGGIEINDSDTIYKISYEPTEENILALSGDIQISSTNYGIYSFYGKTEGDKSLELRFINSRADNYFFPKKISAEFCFNKPGKGDGEKILIRRTERVEDLNLDPDFENVDFEPENQNSSIYVNQANSQELHADSIRRAEEKEKKLSNYLTLLTGKTQVKWFRIPLGKIVDYNGHEGFRFGFGMETNENLTQYLSVGGYYAYGLKDKEHKFGGDLTLNLHQKSNLKLNFQYKNDVVEIGGYDFLKEPDFRSTEMYRKFMIEEMDAVESFQFNVQLKLFKQFKFQAFIRNAQIESLSKYNFQIHPGIFIDNYNITETGIRFRYAYEEQFKKIGRKKYSLGSKYPVLSGNIIQGINDLGGEFEYTKFELKLVQYFESKSFGHTKLTLVGGLVNGDIPISLQYNGHASGSPLSFETENSFATMDLNEFYSDRFISFFFRQSFKPFVDGQFWKPNLVLIHNAGIGEMSKTHLHSANYSFRTMDKGYYEAGFLFNNILYSKGVGLGGGIFYNYGYYSSSKTANNFAYKISLTFGL